MDINAPTMVHELKIPRKLNHYPRAQVNIQTGLGQPGFSENLAVDQIMLD